MAALTKREAYKKIRYEESPLREPIVHEGKDLRLKREIETETICRGHLKRGSVSSAA